MRRIPIICLIILLLIFLPNISRAEDTIGESMTAGSEFIKKGFYTKDDEDGVKIDESKLKSVSSDLFNALYYIGVGASTIVAAILGIKIMITSVEEKAKVKEQLIPYIIGCIVIFGAFGIWKAIVSLFSGPLSGALSGF